MLNIDGEVDSCVVAITYHYHSYCITAKPIPVQSEGIHYIIMTDSCGTADANRSCLNSTRQSTIIYQITIYYLNYLPKYRYITLVI